MSGATASASSRRTLAAVEVPTSGDPVETEREWLRTVGMRVLLARTADRMSQEELGRRAGVSRVTIGSIERGDHPAGVLAYARIAAALYLPIVELLDGYGLPPAAGGSRGVR